MNPPETTLSGSTSGERRRTVLPSGPVSVVVWDPDGPTGGAVSPALWDALRDAVLRAQAEWERVMEHASSPEEVAGYVAQLAAAIRSVAVDATPAGTLEELPKTALARRLLALIRTAFLERVRELAPDRASANGASLEAATGNGAAANGTTPDEAGLLRVLLSMEDVGRHLEADWAQHFSDRLSGPDGLELVVEVAHDLRSPLTSILFLAETLQRARSGPVNAVQERQLGLIYSAAFGLSAVASDVIELARGGDRLVDLDPIPFSVTDIFESVRDIVLPIAEEKGLAVRLQAPEMDFRVGHPVALSRVLLNLTTNALKFTNEGHVEVVGRQTGPTLVEFAVRDTGRGIPPQSMATLYEPFRRRQRPGEYAFSGSGLGLSICRKLVEAMGSRLDVETAANVGTRFYFTLDLPFAGRPA